VAADHKGYQQQQQLLHATSHGSTAYVSEPEIHFTFVPSIVVKCVAVLLCVWKV